LPPLEALFGHHLHFHPEEDGMTPDENDLFPSTPLDEDQLQNADNRLKEQLGDVVINKIEEVCACRSLYIVPSTHLISTLIYNFDTPCMNFPKIVLPLIVKLAN
jgi:hypothetical protein